MTDYNRVFISYARPDQELVEWLKSALAEDTGLDICLVPWSDTDLGPGNWREELAAQLAASDFLAIVLSAHTVEADRLRRWIELESFAAEVLEKRFLLQSFIIRTDESQVPAELKHKNYIDLRQRIPGMEKLRRYLISEAKIRQLFFDREPALKAAMRLFTDLDQSRSLIFCNENDEARLGSSWLLHELHIVLPAYLDPCPPTLLFDSRFMECPKAWFAVLEATAGELGAARFGNYTQLRKKYTRMATKAFAPSSPRGRAPVSSLPTQSGRLRGTELGLHRVMSTSEAQPSAHTIAMFDDPDMAWRLTEAFLRDLAECQLPLVWFIDWPRSGAPGSTTYTWLCELIQLPIHSYPRLPWIIVAGSQKLSSQVRIDPWVVKSFEKSVIEE